MPGKLIYVGHYLRPGLGPCRTAHATPLPDAGAGHRTLEGPQHQFVVHNPIEPRPPEMKRLVQHRSHVGHACYLVRLALQDGLYLRQEAGVSLLLALTYYF